MKGIINIIIILLEVLSSFLLASSSSSSDGIGEWQTLTKQNFSSQIRVHPHILLVIAAPWSGESRSLMKEVSELVKDKQEEKLVSRLKLMFLDRNKEKMLSDAISTAEGGINVVYYHHSLPYKYRGKINARNILHSVLPYISVSPQEIPLAKLGSQEELTAFLQSTDKALLLFEFCGWAHKLTARETRNGTENWFGMSGFSGETNRIADNLKGTESAEMKCYTENGISEIPWLGEFSSVNNSVHLHEIDSQDAKNRKPNDGLSCTFEEFQQFESFFSRFVSVAREFCLPPERHRFGLVSEKSLQSSLGVGDSGSWSAMLYFSGCPSCSRILKEEDDLNSVLQRDNSIVKELEGNGQDIDPALPANKPSIILFVDRFSDSLEARRKGKEALKVFRELALQYHMPDQMNGQNHSQRSLIQAFQEYKRIAGYPRLDLYSTAQKTKLKEKMSIMIVNEGKHAILENMASDFQGSSLQEILMYLLQKKKEAKLSSIAKEVGFQLLSDDLDIQLADTLPSEAKVKSEQVSSSPSQDKESASDHDEISQPSNSKSFSQDGEEKATDVETSRELSSEENEQFVSEDIKVEAVSEATKAEEKISSQADKLGVEEKLKFQGFEGSFFFSDGNYRLLRALTGETRIPSYVIIDPIMEKHYVLPEQTIFSYSSVENFLFSFLNESLVPHQRSEPKPESQKEAMRPPFVNLDFHEADSVPRVTVHTFSEQVLGFNQSDNEGADHARNEDVLVLFSNSWCGFCQRMELIIREVHRAIIGYMHKLQPEYRNGKPLVKSDNLKNAIVKLPKIFLMDCTLNDCSFILKSMHQREVYPSLLLFPAERKTAVLYEGNMAVVNVIEFIADHGSNSQHLTSEKGILTTVTEKRGGKKRFFEEASSTKIEDAHVAKVKTHEVLLKDWSPKRITEYNRIKSHTPKDLHEMTPAVVVGSVLIATEKISAQPFDKSMVVIVKADQNAGFQGLIHNKPIGWDSLHELEEGLRVLKEAPLSFGGPLVVRGMPFVALTRKVIKDQYPEIAPGIYFLDQSATRNEIEELKSGNGSAADYWFFLGFSSWSWDQLFNEIAEGAWNVTENEARHLDWPGDSVN